MRYLFIAFQQQQHQQPQPLQQARQPQQQPQQQHHQSPYHQHDRLHPPPCLSISQGFLCLLSICTANTFASHIPSQIPSQNASQNSSQIPSQTISISKNRVTRGAWVNLHTQSNPQRPVKLPSQIRSKSHDRAEEFWCHVLSRIYGIYLQGIREFQQPSSPPQPSPQQQQHRHHDQQQLLPDHSSLCSQNFQSNILSPVKFPSQISTASQIFSMELTRFLSAMQSFVSGCQSLFHHTRTFHHRH